MRSYLTRQRALGIRHLMTLEAQRISQRLTCRKGHDFLSHRMDEVISSLHGGDPTIAWGLLSEGNPTIPITGPSIWHT